MSESLKFVGMVAPDIFETAGRILNNRPAAPTDKPPRILRRPRQPGLAAPSSTTFAKQEPRMTTTNPKPEEIQASLDAELQKFVEGQPTPEKKAAMLIKIGSYQVELSKYAPMLRDADEALAQEILDEWIGAGDGELKKALINRASGTEEYALLKVAPASEGGEYELAKMLEAEKTQQGKMAVLQKIGVYQTQLAEMMGRAELLKIGDTEVTEAVQQWLDDGDGSHKAMKKALVDAAAAARRQASTDVGENSAIDEKAGNGPTHVASKLSGWGAGKKIANRPSGEGAGPRKDGSIAAPGQQNQGSSPQGGSGPNDTGDGEMSPSIKIRRKGTTGGLGSVAGAEGNQSAGGTSDAGTDGTLNGQDDPDTRMPKTKKKKSAMDKSEDLASELLKILPDAAIGELAKRSPEEQVQICEVAAQDAADLMAWSSQQDPDKMQKAALDVAIRDWLMADPKTLGMKKYIAEALATAEEIPLELGKAIMAFEPPAAVRLRQRVAA